MSFFKFGTSLGLMVSLFPAAPASAEPGPVSVAYCGGASNTARVAQVLFGASADGSTLTSMGQSFVTLSRSGAAASISAEGVVRSLSWDPTSKNTCLMRRPTSIVLETASSVPEGPLASIADVLRFREAHPWPSTAPAHIDNSSSSIYVERQGDYDFVYISDDPNSYARKGHLDESCRGQESYRVNLSTLDVKQFNGCVTGGVRGLPTATQLPK